MSSSETFRVENTYLVGRPSVGFISSEAQDEILITAAMLSALSFTPASAA